MFGLLSLEICVWRIILEDVGCNTTQLHSETLQWSNTIKQIIEITVCCFLLQLLSQTRLAKLDVVIAQWPRGRLACGSGNFVLIIDLSSCGSLPSFLHYTMSPNHQPPHQTNVTTTRACGSPPSHPNGSAEWCDVIGQFSLAELTVNMWTSMQVQTDMSN